MVYNVFMSVKSALNDANLIVMKHEKMLREHGSETRQSKIGLENRMDSTYVHVIIKHVLKCYVKH